MFKNEIIIFHIKNYNKNIPQFILQQFIGRINAQHTR